MLTVQEEVKLFSRLFWPHCFPCGATEAALWAEQCDDRAVLWEHLISSARGAKQQHTMPWYLAYAVSGKIATGPTLIAEMPPECMSAASPVPDHETTRERPSFCMCVNKLSISVHPSVQMWLYKYAPEFVDMPVSWSLTLIFIYSRNSPEYKTGLIESSKENWVLLSSTCPLKLRKNRYSICVSGINKNCFRSVNFIEGNWFHKYFSFHPMKSSDFTGLFGKLVKFHLHHYKSTQNSLMGLLCNFLLLTKCDAKSFKFVT